jgi:hypothetical protein
VSLNRGFRVDDLYINRYECWKIFTSTFDVIDTRCGLRSFFSLDASETCTCGVSYLVGRNIANYRDEGGREDVALPA